MKARLRHKMSCLICGARSNSVLEDDIAAVDMCHGVKKGCATPNASHGASTRIGRGSDCSPWTSAGDNALCKDTKKGSCVDVPCAVSEFEEDERTPSLAGEARLAARPSCSDSAQQAPSGHTPEHSAPASDNRRDQDDVQAQQSGSLEGAAMSATDAQADDETTRRLAQQIEDWGREETGPDIVAIAKAYVGIQKMAQEEALNHRFNMIKHDAIRLRPEAAHVFLSLQRNDFEDLEDMPVPRARTN